MCVCDSKCVYLPMGAKEPYYGGKRDPTMEAKEPYYGTLLWRQKRPTMEAKEKEPYWRVSGAYGA